MKERGLIFGTELIPKVLDETKVMTRRTWGLEFVNFDPDAYEFLRMEGDLAVFHKLRNSRVMGFPPLSSMPKKMEGVDPNILHYIKCPYGQVGDRLWPKETLYRIPYFDEAGYSVDNTAVMVRGTIGDMLKWRWQRDILPAMFMPREASRALLEITELRMERLQDITQEGAIAEGFFFYVDEFQPGASYSFKPKDFFRRYWDSLNPRYPWDFNPWVWPIEFKKL